MQVSFNPRGKRNRRSSVRSRWTAVGLSALLIVSFFAAISSNDFSRVALADTTAQPLNFSQDWSNKDLITTNDDWSGVPGIVGYQGNNTAASPTDVDPQTIVADLSNTVLDVVANQSDPSAAMLSGGVYEFDGIANPTIALNGSGTSDAPHIVVTLNTTGRTNISVSYNVRDLDVSVDNAVQQVALQYRVGTSGNYTNIAAGYIPDATIANSATRVTPINTPLPAAAENQAVVQIRIITTNALGNDETIGIDDISVTGNTAGGGTNPSGTGAANPNPVVAGNQVLLTVTVTPGTSPVSSGLMVTGNLSSIGGAAAQQFYDDGTNGDATAGDNIFSYSQTVSVSTAPGSKTIPVTIKDAQNREGSTSIALNVQPPPAQRVIIGEIQGDALASPFVDRDVETTGVVTLLKKDGFFIQSADGATDNNAATSDGIFVFTGAAPSVAAGNNVTVTGKIVEFNGLTELTLAGTAIVNSVSNALPTAVTLTPEILNSGGATTQLERFEGMRLRADSLTSISPTDFFGDFYTVLTGQPRPLREAGIDIGDSLPSGAPPNIPRFDKNPERLLIDSDGRAGTTKLEVTSNVTVTNPSGVLDFSFAEYKLIPEAALNLSANISARPVPQADANELTIASMNITFFDADATPLAKASLAIRNVMRSPDVIGLQEIKDLASLQTLATRVNNDATAAGQPNPNYQAFLLVGNPQQNVGYLIKSPRVSILETPFQIGKTATFTDPNDPNDPNDDTPAILFDRPPLVTRIAVTNNGATLNVTVINNHLLSLITIEGNSPSAFRGRAKRKAQAEFLANYIQGLQTANPTENISLIGDFNAYQFNDGYVDVIGTIIGTPTPASRVTVASTDLVNPDFFALINELAPQERYSFYFDGSSGDPDGNEQALDHILVNDDLRARLSRHVYARNNADFYESLENDATRPERVSDHDNPVAYFRINTGASTSTLQFEQPTYTVSENARTLNVNVTRTGDTSQAASIDYISNDLLALFNCNPVNPGQYEGTATSRCDYSTAAGTLNFAAGQTTLPITLIITNDVHAEGSEAFSISLRNNTGANTGGNVTATVSITDDDASNGTANPIDPTPDNRFFVRQQYYDFFGRSPADSEVDGWVNAIQPDCGLQQDCIDRIWVSGKGFFFSTEFQLKGDFVYRFYRVGLGRMPTYNEFVPDLVRLKDTTDATKQEFATRFTEREEFRRIYDGLTNDQFVDELERRAGIAITNKAQLKADLTAGTRTRVQVVRAVAESQEVETRFFNESWVAMQYFGYLRRDFSTVEFNGWLRVLNANPNDYRTMVNGFINSIEYRQRFGQP